MCYGTTDGYLAAEATGGFAPYHYEWTNSIGQIISSIDIADNLPAGSYTLLVKDAKNCLKTFSFTLTQTPLPTGVNEINGLSINNGQTVSWTTNKHLTANIEINDGGTLNIIGASTTIYLDDNVQILLNRGGTLNIEGQHLPLHARNIFGKVFYIPICLLPLLKVQL